MTQPSSSTGAGPANGRALATSRPADLGVPLSVWHGLPAPGSGPPGHCGGVAAAAAASRVIGSFSRPGDLVAAAGGCPAAAEAAAAGRRAVLVVLPDGRSGYPAPVPYPAVRLRPGGPAMAPASGNPYIGQVALAVASVPGPACCVSSRDGGDGGLVYAACEQLLRPGGVLAVTTAGPGADEPTGSAVAAARAIGLIYAQHIVLIHAAIDGDHLKPSPLPAGPGGIAVHSDLLIFTKPGGPRP
jgi:hypothetical protein